METQNQEQALLYVQDLYLKNWMVSFSKKSLRFDILVTNEFLYLIEIPTARLHSIGFLFGIIGILITKPFERKIGNEFRSSWIDLNQKIISNQYENATYFKIPRNELKSSVLFEGGLKRLITFTYNNKKIIISAKSKKYEKLKSFIENNMNVIKK